MIQAIIFDCFGVLTTEGWQAFKNEHFGDDSEKMSRASDFSHQLDRGYITYQEALKGISELANVQAEDLDAVLRDTIVDKALMNYIREELKSSYKIGMLSNVRKDLIETVFTPKDIELFDALTLSNKTGVIKPDPRAYMTAAASLGVEPEEVVFIDDLPTNIAGAKHVGMQGIVYRNLAQLKADLRQILAADSEN